MPFWTFFGATLLGKGVIKVSGQVAFFVMLFADSDAHIERVVAWVERVIPDAWEPCVALLGGASCDKRLHTLLLRCVCVLHVCVYI